MTIKFRTIAIFKNSSNKIVIEIQILGMSVVSYCTKFVLQLV
jgi:hypothetical protein